MYLFQQIKSMLAFGIVAAFTFLSFGVQAQTQDGSTPCLARPFCSDTAYSFPNNYGNQVPTVTGPNWGCLGSQPNAIWYYMQIGTPGTIQISIAQVNLANNGIDVDFAMWGPFTDLATGCAAVMGGQPPLQCSYSASATETIGIGLPGGTGTGSSTPPPAQVGEVYIVILTNFGQQQGTISFAQTGGTGSADCGIVCGLSASNSGDICVGNAAVLTASSTDTVNQFTYLWSGPGGFTTTGKVVSVTPPAPGTYEYTVIGISQDDDTCTATTTLVVHPKPNLNLVNPNDQILCNVTLTTLNLDTVSPEFTYQWYKDGVAIPGQVNGNITITDSGNYKISATSAFGCSDTSVTVHIQFNSTNSDFSFHLTEGCTSDVVTFTNLSDPGKYYWNFGDGTPIDTTKNPVHVYTQQGLYQVRLNVLGFNGCPDSTLMIVNTNHPLQAEFSLSTDSVCQAGSTPIQFTDNSIGNAVAWHWDFGDGTTTTAKNPSHLFTTAGTYQVRMVISDTIPCSDTMYHTVFVDSVYSFKLSSDKNAICAGEEITFYIEDFPTGFSGNWTFGDGNTWTGKGNEVKHSYEKAGKYWPSLSVDFPVCPSVSYDADSIIVNAYPKVDLGQSQQLCLNGNPIILRNLAPGMDPKTSYRWNTGDTGKTLTVTHEGTYSVIATVKGCSTKEEVIIEKDCYTDLPNAFTPNGDGENDYFFPRQLLSEGVKSFSMTIVNRWGQKVFETYTVNGRGWDGKFNDKEQPMGVYIYQMTVSYTNGKTENYTGNVTLIR